MSFSVPTFNLATNIWHAPIIPPAAPSLMVTANLQYARHDKVEIFNGQDGSIMYLLVPKLTDIRGLWEGIESDVIECPAGSSRFYYILQVDDVGKGFPNEYRIAIMEQVTDPFGAFGIPFPIPLP